MFCPDPPVPPEVCAGERDTLLEDPKEMLPLMIRASRAQIWLMYAGLTATLEVVGGMLGRFIHTPTGIVAEYKQVDVEVVSVPSVSCHSHLEQMALTVVF
jgi:hypothetical protein